MVCAGLPRWPSPARVFGVGLSDLTPASGEPTADLFAADDLRRARVEAAMDEVRARFGAAAVEKGRALKASPNAGSGRPSRHRPTPAASRPGTGTMNGSESDDDRNYSHILEHRSERRGADPEWVLR